MVPARTPITDERTALPVLGQHDQWLLVRLPGRPNGHTGWITGARRPSRRHRVASRRRTSRRDRDRLPRRSCRARSFKVVVGKPSTPTPTGEFFVEETIALRAYDVGAPFALALSARSNVLQEFDGGPGQIALHGLQNVGGVPGTAVSHGCVRLDNDDEVARRSHRRGTPVTIAAH